MNIKLWYLSYSYQTLKIWINLWNSFSEIKMYLFWTILKLIFREYTHTKYQGKNSNNDTYIDLPDDIMLVTFIYMHEMPAERDTFPICKVITKNFITTTRSESISNDISVNNCCLTSWSQWIWWHSNPFDYCGTNLIMEFVCIASL